MKSSTTMLIILQATAFAGQSFCYDLRFGDGEDWFDSYGYKDDAQWFDSYGYTCAWYSEDKNCFLFGADADAKNGGMTANQACCACGGGSLPIERRAAIEPVSPSTTLSGGFDWGTGCSAGGADFALDMSVRYSTKDVGLIPAGKYDVEVWLTARADLDVTLFDVSDTSVFPEGRAIVQWCSDEDLEAGANCGLLGDARQGEVSYKGMRIIYSGFDGVDGKKGNEFVRILGETTVPLMMKAYAYETGRNVLVSYNWGNARSACCKGEKGACGGSFTATLAKDEVLTLGVVPTGKGDLHVKLLTESGEDIDIQIYDLDDTSTFAVGRAIVAFCEQSETQTCNYGPLTAAGPDSMVYNERKYSYSGWDGSNDNKGDEFISIEGTTNRNLLMTAFGYDAGTATVVYSYTEPQNQRLGMKILKEAAEAPIEYTPPIEYKLYG